MQPTPMRHPVLADPPLTQPWWRHGHVWLVIGGPAVVVVASFATLVLALRQPDLVLADDAYRHGVQVGANAQAGANARALMPALQGRDHAVSPVPPANLAPGVTLAPRTPEGGR